MEFRILGPLEVFDGGRPLSIRRGKEQALLAYLLLHANEIVPSGRLVDELWDERAPATASKILQNAVSHLRRQLGDGRLVTQGPGYLLRVDEGELDLQRFEQLREEGRFREALELWRGPPLLDLRDERFADEARRRLEEQRLAVLEDRIEADLGEGRHTDLVSELEGLVAEHPLRERFHEQLMVALYRAGRQADALQAYRKARRTLSEELGLEPGPRLQELERKILKQEPDLAAPPRSKRPLARIGPGDRHRRRLAVAAVAGVLVVATLVSLGLIYALKGGSKPLVVMRNSLVAVDPARNRIVGVVPVGSTPRGVAVGGRRVWVANSGEGTVSKVDPDRLKVVQTIGIGEQATDVAVRADNVWVVTGIDNTLVHIDAPTGGVLERLRLSRDPSASAYAVAVGRDALWTVSGAQLIRLDLHSGAIVRGRRHRSLADVDVGAGAVWVADRSFVVARISAITGRTTGVAKLDTLPAALAVGYGSVWIAVPVSHPYDHIAAWRLDPQTVRITETIPVGPGRGYPPTLGIAAGAGAIWVTNYAYGTLTRIDPKSLRVVAKIRLGHHPYAVAVGAYRVWVTVN